MGKPPNTRMKELMLKCAENLDNGCEAMHHTFLVENNVTANECFTLGQQMAVAVRGYANATPEIVLKIIMCSEFKTAEERDTMLAALERSQTQKSVLERLKKL